MLQHPPICCFQKLPLQLTFCNFLTHHLSLEFPSHSTTCVPLAITLLSLPNSIYFIPVSISVINWDFSKLLLLSEDVESNPWRLPVNKNLVFCTICSSMSNQGIQESMAPTCSETNCYARCHQAFNGLTSNQDQHAKFCGRFITWKCSQHCTGIA